MIKLTVDEQDFGTICVCALRYAMGRMTYMPDLVRGFIRPLLPRLADKTISVMLQDCEFQERMHMWGDAKIDRPGWVKWKKELEAEMERRKREAKE